MWTRFVRTTSGLSKLTESYNPTSSDSVPVIFRRWIRGRNHRFQNLNVEETKKQQEEEYEQDTELDREPRSRYRPQGHEFDREPRSRYRPQGHENQYEQATEEYEQDTELDREPRSRYRQQGHEFDREPRSRYRPQGHENEYEQATEKVITSPVYDKYPLSRYTGRKKLKTYIENASTYGDLQGTKIVGDPFLTGPYPKGTGNPFSHQGNSAAEESANKGMDASLTSVILFPGQGAQYLGMCGSVEEMPRHIAVLYEIASSLLGYDLLELCSNGPKEKLDQTAYCQPAMLVSSLAALERLRDSKPKSIETCVSTAGFSVGELAALVFSGVISYEDSIRLVKVRAEAMQITSEITPSSMATVLYGADSKLNYSMLVAKEWCQREYNIENPVCSVANYLFPHCKVVAGHTQAIEFLELNHKDFNLRKVKRLPVSGAFHTDLMRPAAEAMKAMMKNITINKPHMPVFSNVTGSRYHSSDEVRRLLPKQMFAPVRWEQVVHTIFQRPKEVNYPNTFECGPGKSLSTVLKMVNAKAHAKSESIDP